MDVRQADALKQYLKSIEGQYKLGIATEHTHRGALQTLLEALYSHYSITNEPQRIKCGAPDYVIQKSGIPVGYIEAKDIDKNLGEIAKSEQLQRYAGALDNLVLTDYLEFRFYRNAELVCSCRLADTHAGKIKPREAEFDAFLNALDCFFSYEGQTISSALSLARKMALKARQMAVIVKNILLSDDAERTTIYGQMEAFRDILIEDIDVDSFSDMYAQTIAYGMFAARLNDPSQDTFSRREAQDLIPRSNPFLRSLFDSVSGVNIDEELIWIVDDLANVFRAADLKKMLDSFGLQTESTDPFIHFYETFLREYNPTLRKNAGVYYTPLPVVEFMVKAVDDILEKDFGLPLGLASMERVTVEREGQPVRGKSTKFKESVPRVQILDPSCGTGTYPVAIIKRIHERFTNQQGMWNSYVEEELIPRLYGFELLMAPYTICQLKMDMQLRQTGYTGKLGKRFNVYLTNSLEEAHDDCQSLFSMWLSNEARAASEVKKNAPIFTVIGNPPYVQESQNKGAWIMSLMEDYKMEPGGLVKLKERNPKSLNDDYVKFIRYAQNYIERNGEGVVAFINPHGYLDNVTFRGMRWSLLNCFDDIYILDLQATPKERKRHRTGGRTRTSSTSCRVCA